MKTNYLTEDLKWVYFYPNFNSNLYIEKAGYFDERPQLHTSITQLLVLFSLPFLAYQSLWFLSLIPLVFFGWGKLHIYLPIKTGIQDCESPAWGFNYHDNTIWIYIGGSLNMDGGKKWKTIRMFWDMEWVRTSTKMKSGYDWFHESKNNRVDWGANNKEKIGSYEWVKENMWKETHKFTDNSDGTIVNATISVKEREWRPLGFQWTSLFAKTRKTIEIDFDQEVGKEKGSFKGGVFGCNYDLLANETPYECLKRMEKERKF
jgi:hypothetical protein